MNYKGLERGFIQRTLMYGAAGICGVSVDTVLFFIITTSPLIMPISGVNILTYSLGTLCSYCLNKSYSFRSLTHRLSFRRFLLTSFFGMLASTSILLFLINLSLILSFAKIIATVFAVLLQYAINTRFSLVSK